LFRIVKILSFIILVNVPRVYSQDSHFSQFFSNSLALNPALTGNFIGDWRVSGNYRNQWRNIAIPYNTYSFGYDRMFYPENHRVGGGVFLVNDNSGDAALNVTRLYLSGSYYRDINNNDLSAGIQVGYVFKSYNYSGATFPSQFDMTQGYFNSNLPSGELGIGERLSYLDINIGASWRKKIKIFEPRVGLSLFHLNVPKESYYNFNTRVPLKILFHAKMPTDLSDNMYLAPGLVYIRQRNASEMLLGSDLGFRFRGNFTNVDKAFTGIYFRDGIVRQADAIIVMAGAQAGRLDVILSYDFTVSPLGVVTNNRGAFEISFIYRSISTILNSYSIPCERL